MQHVVQGVRNPRTDRRSSEHWLEPLVIPRPRTRIHHYWKAVVAISAKNARMAWAVLAKGENFKPLDA